MPSKLLPTEPLWSTGTTDQGEYLSAGERKAIFRKRRISGAAFKRGSSADSSVGEARGGKLTSKDFGTKTGKLTKILRDTRSKVLVNEKKIAALEQALDISQSSVASPALLNAVQAIAASVDNIVGILKGQADAQKDAAADARVAGEEKEAKGREKGLETKTFSGLKKVGQKIMKPIQSIWDKLIHFITTVLLGRVVIKFIEWFSDGKNAEKISSLFRFLKDWWPALVAGLMLFLGPGILSAVGLVALLAWGVPKIVDVAKYIWELPGKIFAFLKGGPGGDNKIDTKTTPSGVSRQDARQGGIEGGEDAPEGVDLQMGENLKQDASKLEEPPTEFAQGGQVPGSGNRDTVPAMLTPGEFVMSKGAVSKWGASTLASMNAAGGGTNRPSIMNQYRGGGSVLQSTTNNFNLKGYRGGGYINKPMVVKGYAGGGAVTASSGDSTMTIKLSSSQSGPGEVSPPSAGRGVTLMQADGAAKNAKAKAIKSPGSDIPDFSADTMVSPYKIKTLGITV